jgi:flagellar basal-body rod protein FlgC
MSTLERIMNNAASGMSAQSVRLNTIASNLANADNVGQSNETAYHRKSPVFSEVTQKIAGLSDEDQPLGGVAVNQISKSQKPLQHRHDPDNPLADENGEVYITDVNPIEEMTDMISASKEYQADVDVMNTTKSLIQQTISVLSTKE